MCLVGIREQESGIYPGQVVPQHRTPDGHFVWRVEWCAVARGNASRRAKNILKLAPKFGVKPRAMAIQTVVCTLYF